jgi:uncharacterized membrane protein
MDIPAFLGKLHPLVVHLPIGTLVLVGVFIFLWKQRNVAGMEKAISIGLLISLLGAIFSVVFGLLLMQDGDYGAGTIDQHQWLGIILTIYTLVLYLQSQNIILPKRLIHLSYLPAMILLSITGHLGGTLTHGEGYLEQALFGENETGQQHLPSVDSIVLYADLIRPILDENCVQCHSAGNAQGNLDLSSWEGLQKGHVDHHGLLSHAEESELYERISLPQDHVDFMPPRGEGLDYIEVELIRFWLDQGAEQELKLVDTEMDESLGQLMLRDWNLDTRPKAYYEKLKLPPADSSQINQLQAAGWNISTLSSQSTLLEISASAKDTIDAARITALKSIAENITWLDLGSTDLSADALEQIADFPNLTRLRLDNTEIESSALGSLGNLNHLESINLYNTKVDDEVLQILSQIPSLKRVFLWGTEVSEEGAEKFKKGNPNIQIDLGSDQAAS